MKFTRRNYLKASSIAAAGTAVLGLPNFNILRASVENELHVAPDESLTLINYLDKPLPQSAIAVDATAIYKELNISQGTPLSTNSTPLFLIGDKMIFYARFDAGERKVLTVKPAAQWNEPDRMLNAGEEAISNGILTARLIDGAFNLDFSNGSMLKRLRWDGAVSYDLNATRHSWEELPTIGKFAHLRTRTLDGSGVEMVTEKTVDILKDSRLRVNQRVYLPKHQPIAEYRSTLTNIGTKKFFLSMSTVYGDYGDLLTGELELQEPRGSGEEDLIDMDFSKAPFTRLPLWREWAQRPRRWGNIPNCAVVSPSGYAVGFSSLDYYGPIWMNSERWFYRPSSFQLRAITKGSHFPILLEPGQSIEVGNIFYCFTPDNLAFGETFRAFKEVRNGQTPSITASAAVMIGNIPIKRQFIRQTVMTAMEGETLALRVNLAEIPQLQLVFKLGPDIGEINVLDSNGNVQKRATSSDTDTIEYILPDILEGSGVQDLTLKVVGTRAIASMILAPAPADAPELEMPVEGMDITDIASSFKWKAVPGFGKYELEVANDRAFTIITLRENVSLGDVAFGYFQCLDLLKTGRHFWRVRAVGGNWSNVSSFHVNNDYSTLKPKFALAEGEPFFTFYMRPVEPYVTKYRDNPIPRELRGNSTLITYLTTVGSPETGQSIRKDTQETAKQNIHIAYRTLCMADTEWAFQNLPNVTGFVDGENLGSLVDMGNDSMTPNRLTRRQFFRYSQLCAKYGGYIIFGDGHLLPYAKIGIDEEWHDLMAKYGHHVLLGHKTNITDFMHATVDANMGLYLKGIFRNFYYETERWYWDHAGYRELGTQFGFREGDVNMCPAMFDNLQILAGLARGASGFKSEALVGRWNVLNDPESKRIILPFLRALITHKMVPSKKEVLNNIKVAVVLPKYAATIPIHGSWGPYEALYEATYGLRAHSEYNQNWPDNSRYYFIPLLPIGTKQFHGIKKVVPLEELTSVEKVKAIFDPLYPPIIGDAFRAVVGDKIFIMPGRENEDRVYTYSIPLKGGKISGLDGNIGPMEYLIGKRGDGGDSIWLQSDAAITHWKRTDPENQLIPVYEFPDTTFAIRCFSKPDFEVKPKTALKSAKWKNGKLILTLSHKSGAVEITASVK